MIRLLNEMQYPIDGWEEKDPFFFLLTGGKGPYRWLGAKVVFFSPNHQYGIASHPPPCRGFYHIINYLFIYFFDLNHIIKLDKSITINGPKSRPFPYF